MEQSLKEKVIEMLRYFVPLPPGTAVATSSGWYARQRFRANQEELIEMLSYISGESNGMDPIKYKSIVQYLSLDFDINGNIINENSKSASGDGAI